MIAVSEVKGTLAEADPHFGHHHDHGHEGTDGHEHAEPSSDPELAPGE